MNLYNERYFVAPYNMPPNPKGVGLTFTSDRNPTSRSKDMSNQVVPGIAHALAKVTRGTHAQYIPMDEEFFFRGYSLTERKIGRAQFEGRLKYPFTSKEEILHKSLPRITLVGNNYYYPPTRVYIQRRLDTITNSLETHFFDLMGVYLDDMDPIRRTAEIGKLYNKGYMGRPGLLNFLSQYLQDHFCTNEDPVRRPRITQSTRIRQQVQPNPIPAYAFIPGTWLSTLPTPGGRGARGPGGRGGRGGPGGPGGRGGPGDPGGRGGPGGLGGGRRRKRRRGRYEEDGDGNLFGDPNPFLEAWAHYVNNGGGEEAFMALQEDEITNVARTRPTEDPTTTERGDTLEDILNTAGISPETQERIQRAKERDAGRRTQSAGDPNTLTSPTHRTTGMDPSSPEDRIYYLSRVTEGETPFNPNTHYEEEEEYIDSPIDESKASYPPPLESKRTEKDKQQQEDASKGLSERISTQANRYLNSIRENKLNAPYSDMLAALMLDVDTNGQIGGLAIDINDTLKKDLTDFEEKRQRMVNSEEEKEDRIGMRPIFPIDRVYSRLEVPQLTHLHRQKLKLCFHHLKRMEEEEVVKRNMTSTDLQDERGRSTSFLDLNQALLEFAQVQKNLQEEKIKNKVQEALVRKEYEQKKYFTTSQKEEIFKKKLEEGTADYKKPLRFYMGVLPTVLTNSPEFEDVIDFGSITYLYQEVFRTEFNHIVALDTTFTEENVPAIHATLFAMQMKYLFYRQTEEFENLMKQQAVGTSPSVNTFYRWLRRDPSFVAMKDRADQEIVDAFFNLPGMSQTSCADAFEDPKTLLFSCSLMAAKKDDYDDISKKVRDYLK